MGNKVIEFKPTVCKILKDKDKWLSINPNDTNRQKDKDAKYPDLEIALMIWFNQAISDKRVITSDIILTKAKIFAKLLDINDFKGSDGWLSNFKKRNNIKQYVMHGEASSAPSEERRRLQEIIKEFPLEDACNGI
ncbi:11156_t:CDS:2 [Entrophospora sp. SA101]|nr:11156_t:CDS:2 [Entrophospora sp. SA101]